MRPEAKLAESGFGEPPFWFRAQRLWTFGRWTFNLGVYRPGSSVGRATDFKNRREPVWSLSREETRTAMSECRSLLGRPESHPHHNVAGNGERDGLKSG